MAILLPVVALLLLILWVVYRMAFFSDRGAWMDPYAISPKGEYQARREEMLAMIGELAQRPFERVYLTSHDGLRLTARYYHTADGAPLDIAFHGYRGHALRDFCGGSRISFGLNHNLLLVDQRASSASEGHVITFGIKEHRDCLSWINFMVEHFGQDVKIILTGISMGASTVLMAAGSPLPEQVKGVLADCGFSSAKDIICKVIRQLKFPSKLVYPFVRLGAWVFGGFDPESFSALEAVTKATVPVIFFHGEEDAFVPAEMSKENYDACASRKAFITTPGAGHGLCYPVDPEGYLQALRDFFGSELSRKT